MPGALNIILSGALVVLLVIAVWQDLASRTIPNALNLAVAALAPVSWWAAGLPLWPDAAIQIGIAAIVFALFTLAFALGMMGGGDVKLITALAGWSGLFQLPILFLAISLCGGVLAVVLLLARHGAAFAGVQGPRLLGRGEPLPYAVAIAGGVIWWVWATGGGPLVAA